MYRGRKALPVQNKICNERYVTQCQARHRQKLREIKSSIDNKSPRPHLKSKAKKNALMEERFAQIENENRLLVGKMCHIMRFKGGIDTKNESIQYSQSLNRNERNRGLQRIMKENHQILKRIQEAKPTYDHRAWAEDARVNDRILANICEFKNGSLREESKGTCNQDLVFDDYLFN